MAVGNNRNKKMGSQLNPLANESTAKNNQLHPLEILPVRSETKSTLLDGFEERWAEFNAPVGAPAAMVKCLLVIAYRRSHDPILLHRITGYPLCFVNMITSGLTQSEFWLTWGYEELIGEIEEHPDNVANIDILLCTLMEHCWRDPMLDYERLHAEWSRCMGIVGDQVVN